jgi:hypothetical protein
MKRNAVNKGLAGLKAHRQKRYKAYQHHRTDIFIDFAAHRLEEPFLPAGRCLCRW